MTYTAIPPQTGDTWITIIANQTLVPGQNYYINGAGALNALLLPPVCSEGQTIKLWDIGGNGFTVTQGVGQSILMGRNTTTVGVVGSIISTQLGNKLELVCSINNLNFTADPGLANFMAT